MASRDTDAWGRFCAGLRLFSRPLKSYLPVALAMLLISTAVVPPGFDVKPASAATWDFESLDSAVGGGAANFGSATTVYNNQLHTFYYGANGTQRMLRHAWYDGTWHSEILDSPLSYGYAPASVVLGGQLHIFNSAVLRDANNVPISSSWLRHGWYDGSTWQFETLEPLAPNTQSGYGTSAVIYNNQLHVIDGRRASGVSTVRHSVFNGTSWQYEVIESNVSACCSFGSATVVFNNQLHTFYEGATGTRGLLRHAWYDGSWHSETLDNPTSFGFSPAALVTGGRLHLFNSGVLRDANDAPVGGSFLRHGSYDGATWQFETLDTGVSNGSATSPIATNGELHILTQGFESGSTRLRHGVLSSGAWQFETVDSGLSTGAGTSSAVFGNQLHAFNRGSDSSVRHGRQSATLTATKLAFIQQPSASAIAGVTFGSQPIIEVQDVGGNRVTSENSTIVTLAKATGGPGSLSCQGGLSRTMSNGQAVFSDCKITQVGSFTLRATAQSLTQAESSSITVSESPDSDGDGLRDAWEEFGITIDDGAGPQFIDLPTMGSDKNKPDIFLHIDWMQDATHNQALSQAAIKQVVDAFAISPYVSPTGSVGINLHVDQGPASVMNFVNNTSWGMYSRAQTIPYQSNLGTAATGVYDWMAPGGFQSIKDRQGGFTQSGRSRTFHYVIAAHNYDLDFPDPSKRGSSGVSRGIESSDFVVSLGSFTGGVGSQHEQAGTLMHELGHNLGLQHGGGDGTNYKPNYLSVMNYAFQIRGTIRGGTEGNVDYSRSDLGPLNETRLSEASGLGSASAGYGTRHYCPSGSSFPYVAVTNANGPLDWNCNGSIAPAPATVAFDSNNDPPNGAQTTLTGFDDWRNLKFKVGTIGSSGIGVNLPTTTQIDPMTPAEAAKAGPIRNSINTLIDKDQCKNGGWETFDDSMGIAAFRNQGDCVSYVATHGRNTGSGR